MVLEHNYISSDGLTNLRDYRYHCVDHSLVAKHIGQPFWRAAVEFLPTWLAPNLITLIGFSLMLTAFLTLCFFAPTASESAPGWAYLLFSLFLFCYQQLDALDGKQARRTGSSSPLGELFDHGCDAMATVFIGVAIATMLRFGTHPWLFLVLAVCACLLFFLAQWEEYHTGVMFLGHVGVTEFHLLTEALFFATFWFGPELWWSELPVIGLELRFAVVAAVVVGLFATVSHNVLNVVNFYKEGKVSETHPQAKESVLLQLVPVAQLFGTTLAWALFSPSDVLHNYLVPFFVAAGFFSCFLVGRIVVCRVCKMYFPFVHPILFVYSATALLACLSLVPDGVAVWALVAVAVLNYLHFALNIIRQMCDYLGIMCLRIPVKKQE
eukprot:TRINITY_DN13298_c0_g1_i1.p1 TRINITY_DN13298_c0_g1~~TRINITY_DN13298_c0_g1_i1.p1  ORF type:complete len:417 (+),score=124.24 TRINITY_DN13298_c0_g1_i1:110-1252(+)